MSEPQYPLVWIEWQDSAQSDSAWRFADHWTKETSQIVECVTVGFLVHDGDQVKAVAQNLGDKNTPDAVQASGVIRIPTKCVTRLKRLKEPSSASSRRSA